MQRLTWTRWGWRIFRPQPGPTPLCTAIFNRSVRIMPRSALLGFCLRERWKAVMSWSYAATLFQPRQLQFVVLLRALSDAATRQETRVWDIAAGVVDRVTKLDAILHGARLEDFVVINEDRPINDVAQEMLIKAGWIAS